jgi:hypothetical protein
MGGGGGKGGDLDSWPDNLKRIQVNFYNFQESRLRNQRLKQNKDYKLRVACSWAHGENGAGVDAGGKLLGMSEYAASCAVRKFIGGDLLDFVL